MKKEKVSLVSIKLGLPERREINKVIKNNWITMGPLTEEFENKFAKFVGAKYAVAVNSCTSALQIAVAQRELGSDDEVITTPFTWISTTTSILYAGAKPVFADIDINSGNISLESIKKVETSKTKGILLIHYAGWPASDIERIVKYANEKKWFVIEDCAHCIGTKYKNKHVGTFGVSGCFSFGSTKTITTGEGGMVVTDDKDVYESLKVLRNYGSTNESYKKFKSKNRNYEILNLSYNFKINELASAVGVAQLQRVNGFIRGRQKTLKCFEETFSNNINAKILYTIQDSDVTVSPLFLPLVLNEHIKDKRDEFIQILKREGIASVIQYPIVYEHPVFKRLIGDFVGTCPIAENISSRILSIPCHGEVTKKNVESIVNLVNKL